MLKPIVTGVLGLLLAILAVSGAVWVETRDAYALFAEPLAPVDSTTEKPATVKRDSATIAPADPHAPAEAGHDPLAQADSAAAHAANAAARGGPATGAAGGESTPSDAPQAGENRLSEADQEAVRASLLESQKHYGQLFASMKPAEAVAILEHLPDDVVRGLLSQVPARTASPILSRLPSERAARIAGPMLPTLTIPARP